MHVTNKNQYMAFLFKSLSVTLCIEHGPAAWEATGSTPVPTQEFFCPTLDALITTLFTIIYTTGKQALGNDVNNVADLINYYTCLYLLVLVAEAKVQRSSHAFPDWSLAQHYSHHLTEKRKETLLFTEVAWLPDFEAVG